jgi:hypothetical protein
VANLRAPSAARPSASRSKRATDARRARSCRAEPPACSLRSAAACPGRSRSGARSPVAATVARIRSAARGERARIGDRASAGAATRAPVTEAMRPSTTTRSRLAAGPTATAAPAGSSSERVGPCADVGASFRAAARSIRTCGRDERDGASAAAGDGTSVASPPLPDAAGAASTWLDVSWTGAAGAGSGGAEGAAAGCWAAGGGAGAGGGLGAGGAAGAGGGLGALRGGSSASGSRYVSLSPIRTPRWRYVTSCSASPVGPGSAIASPSATFAPWRTCSGPRCVSDAL